MSDVTFSDVVAHFILRLTISIKLMQSVIVVDVKIDSREKIMTILLLQAAQYVKRQKY